MKLLCSCTIIVGIGEQKHNSIPALLCVKIFLNGFLKSPRSDMLGILKCVLSITSNRTVKLLLLILYTA